ncbi:hypothetical protein [Streptomyces sp. NPDC055189]
MAPLPALGAEYAPSSSDRRAPSTYPLLAAPGVPALRDKKFPGKYSPGNATAPGLHRITAKLHKNAYNENLYHKNGACFKTGRYKDLY